MKLDKKTILKLLLIIFISILFYVILGNLGIAFSIIGSILGIFTPFFAGLCIAFVLNIPMRFLETRLCAPLNRRCGRIWRKLRRPLCLTLSVLIILSAIALLLVLIIPKFTEALIDFFVSFPELMSALNARIDSLIASFPALAAWKSHLTIDWAFISNVLLEWLGSDTTLTVGATIDILTGTFKAVFNAVLATVFALYILASKEKLGRQVRRVLFALFKREHVREMLSVCSLASRSFGNFVLGQCTEAVILGVLCFLGMLIFSIPHATIISVLIGVTALVPVFGALIGTAIGAFMILLISPVKALWFVIFIVLLQQFETHLIYPKVVGKSVGLPGILVLFSVTVGAEIMGAFGMLVSVPICSVLYTLVDRWLSKRNMEKNATRHEPVPPVKEQKERSDSEKESEE